MRRKVCFIYRKNADTPSIERVFGILDKEFEKLGLDIIHTRLPYGNSFAGIIANLLFFRAPKADIFHITGHVHYIGLSLPSDKTLLTVHDLGILRNRVGMRRLAIKKLFFDWPFRRLRHITAISDATRFEMIGCTNCESKKITVINDPLDPKMISERSSFNADRPTILLIGTAPNKNLDKIVESVAGLACRLIVVGAPSSDLISRMKQLEIEYECLKANSDHEMYQIYGRSDIVAFCSTFEGFGMPIIEAQSMGIPLITSNIAPMNQVAGDGAILVDPRDVGQIRSAIDRIIADPGIRDRIVAAGKSNVKRFDSVNIARQYLNVYQQINVES